MIIKRINVQIGDKYNRLTIIEDLGIHITSGGNKLRIMLCKCDCRKITKVTLNQLRQNGTVSCGCYNLQKAGKHFLKHGKAHTRLYSIWKDMLRRCNNPNRKNYCHYGGRGIKVCDDWANDFDKFYSWAMDNGYTDDLTIDRIDNDGNYEPSNCRWITSAQQKSNTRSQKLFKAISPDGKEYESLVISHFAKEHGLDRSQIGDCLHKRQNTHKGWKFEYVN